MWSKFFFIFLSKANIWTCDFISLSKLGNLVVNSVLTAWYLPCPLWAGFPSGHVTCWLTQSSSRYKFTCPNREPFSYLPRTGGLTACLHWYFFPLFSFRHSACTVSLLRVFSHSAWAQDFCHSAWIIFSSLSASRIPFFDHLQRQEM